MALAAMDFLLYYDNVNANPPDIGGENEYKDSQIVSIVPVVSGNWMRKCARRDFL